MLIFILLLVSIIVFGLLTNIFTDRDSFFVVPSAVGFGFSIIITVFVIISIAINVIDMPAEIAKLNTEYEIITYQLDNINELYGKSRANDKKALYDEIKEWNEEIVKGRARHESLWTNWMHPIDYEQFKLIELTN